MSNTELELKFVVNRPALSLWDDSLKQKFEAGGFVVGTIQTQKLENTYYDTDSHLFEQEKMGMRVRGVDGIYEQTLKTQKAVKGGLHERMEFNVDLPSAKPDIELFSRDIWAQLGLSRPYNDRLLLQFTTHFTRLTIHLTHQSGEVELVFDEGKIKTENAEQALNEIEVELISGDAALLVSLAANLTALGVRLSDVSKAAQGYELLQGLPNKIKPLPVHLMLHEDMSTEEVFCLGCDMAMSHWQHH